jgi:predicted  nucleic acid-binding Zn-ribbon protein
VAPRDWWGLWWQGRADARRRLPRLLETSDVQLALPHVEAIRRQTDEACSAEHLATVGQLLALQERARRASREVTYLAHRLAAASQELNRLESLAPDPTSRRRGEEALEPWLVARRREREHERTLVAARDRVKRLARRHEIAERAVLDVRSQIEDCRDHSRMRMRGVVAHAERRMALYWRALVRRHRFREDLSERWALPPVAAPSWVDVAGAR